MDGIETYVRNTNSDNSIGISNRIINTIDALAVLYSILIERGLIDHKPLQKITVATDPLAKCLDCGAIPDKEGKMYHSPGCKA